MSVRTDTLVVGPLSNDDFFVLGGFLHPIDRSIVWNDGYSLYLYNGNNVSLCRGWKSIDNLGSPYQVFLCKWKWAWDFPDLSIRPGVKLPYVLEVYDANKNRISDMYLGYNLTTNSLQFAPLYQSGVDCVFDLTDSMYDWNTGAFNLQAWNVMLRDPSNNSKARCNSIIDYVYNTSVQDGFPIGFMTPSVDSIFNFVPIPLTWFASSTITSPLILQQCFRYQQLGVSSSVCTYDYNASQGNVNATDAKNSNYLPYFISNRGCGTRPVTKNVDTLGQPITVRTGYGKGGVCVRDQNTNFYLQSASGCSNCTPNMCPDAFNTYCPKIPDCPKCPECPFTPECPSCPPWYQFASSTWFWIVIGVIVVIVLVIVGVVLYQSSSSSRKSKSSSSSLNSSYRSSVQGNAPKPAYYEPTLLDGNRNPVRLYDYEPESHTLYG